MSDNDMTGLAADASYVPVGPRVVQIDIEQDIARARREAKGMMGDLGFSSVAAMEVLIAVTELATNLHVHATPGGEIFLAEVQMEVKCGVIKGIEVISLDQGPGIADIELAMQDRYSTVGSMGCGLPAVKRLMDEFELSSQADKGLNCSTRIVARKWRR